MKRFKIPIFTEEYKVVVCIGTKQELSKLIAKECTGWDESTAMDFCERARGGCFDRLPDRHPLIVVDIDLGEGVYETLPHEASHAADQIMASLGMDDRSGEFRGHVISAVMRHCNQWLLKCLKPLTKPKNKSSIKPA